MAAAGALKLTAGRRADLERLARFHPAWAREMRPARDLLWVTDGVWCAEIARRCASTVNSVGRWRGQLAADGTAAVGAREAGTRAPSRAP